MLKKLPIKKEYLFVAATFLLLLISYQFAFKKTIEAWQTHSNLKKQLTQSTDLSYEPGYLQRKNSNLSNIIDQYKADTVDFRGKIISTISSVAEKENVKLTEVPTQDPLYRTNHFIIQKLNFEGDFFALTKVMNELQKAKGLGMVRAATLSAVTTRSINDEKKKLIMAFYLEVAR